MYQTKILIIIKIVFFIFIGSKNSLGQNIYVNNLLNTISERSYIQLMRGNVPVRNQNLEGELNRTTFMEAQIAPNYFLRFGDSSHFAVSISPKLILRMGGGESFPIKTPSFMPTISAYQKLPLSKLRKKNAINWLIKPQHNVFFLLRMVHHSNGQKDDFFISGTRRINFGTGNFSTDYIEAGLQWTDMSGGEKGFAINGRLSLEQHVDITREQDLKEIYFSNRIILENEFVFTKQIQLGTKLDLMLGQGSRFETKSSFQTSLEMQPNKSNSDLSLFLRFYTGPDYYNIRYFSHQSFLGFGIRANPNSKRAMLF